MGDSTGHERPDLGLKSDLQNPTLRSKMGPNVLMSWKVSGFGPLEGHQNSRNGASLQDIRDVMSGWLKCPPNEYGKKVAGLDFPLQLSGPFLLLELDEGCCVLHELL